ncbi:hypothetical protein A9264_04670 [Vibrio sp. UCD-FRSSP16_10]|uniref:endonuclease/exonuclease/phosphatase family protein n=1 Tax=unclassified Vibrio TaxID=2614977 RepID=UPI0007FDBB2D|nr:MULTISPECIES: endonuclease/exonuclease/phosphatase family protein [unclassified Vibrio]OBT08532.1 hypothetical protein A9260_06910 [Vibrio sp. UCD-FRSSP16_30]OBT18062.1 hypothetical protein A9264_04670 [Vibrio sp. UCD-FRSSP16_10]
MHPHQFTIATFNLFNYLAPPGAYYDFENIYSASQWQDKQQWTHDQIKQTDADIIGFQEVFSPSQLQQQLNALGYPYFAVVDKPHIEDEYIYSEPVVGIASRFPLLSVEAVANDPLAAKELGFSYSRAPLHALVEVPNLGKLDVVVVHFKSQRPKALSEANEYLMDVERWRSTMQRGLEARFLSAFLTRRKNVYGYPQLLMGDFNRDIHSAEFSGFTHNDEKTSSETGLTHSALLATEPCAFIATHYYGAKGSVLDYIMLSDEFDCHSASCLYEVSEYSVLDSHLVNPIYAIDRMASDHGIVTVTVKERG